MHVAFRTDASMLMGVGHVMRCLALANAMRIQGAICTFICRPHSGHLIELIKEHGHDVKSLPLLSCSHKSEYIQHTFKYSHWLGVDWATDADHTKYVLKNRIVDLLIVDHYALDKHWESVMRACCKHLLVIDDLANRAHDCDLLLDQNLGRCEADYANLIKPHVPKLIGPNYALLRPEFRKLRGYSLGRRIHPKLSKILISMGGIDIDNITLKVLDALQSSNLPEGIQINVVMGSHAPWLQEVQEMALKMSRPTRVLVGVSNMAQIMADSDLAIGAAGGTSWERCCLGLPTLLLVLAPNQYESALALEKAGAAILLENTEQISNLFENSEFAISNFKMLQQVSKAAAALTTGDGAECVSSTILDWYE